MLSLLNTQPVTLTALYYQPDIKCCNESRLATTH